MHTTRSRSVPTILAALLLLASGAAAQDATELLADGARAYGNMCGRCHTARSPLERSDAAWVTIVNHMRVRGNLTGKQVRAILAFLQATNTDPATPSGGPPPPVTGTNGTGSNGAPAVVSGETLVAQKACIGCHVIGNVGGMVGPTLNGVLSRQDKEFVRQKLADPTFNNSTSMMPNFGLTPEEIESILTYLESVRTDP